jgi:predicted nucleic acid-binding protein
MALVIDTSVMIDMLIEHRPRHEEAIEFAHLISRMDEIALTPMHMFFELLSAVMCEKRTHGAPPKTGEFEGLPCRQQSIPIDNDFLRDYLFEPMSKGEFIDLGAGDMIIVAVARKHRVPLITEDKKMARISKELGVDVCSIQEYMTRYG